MISYSSSVRAAALRRILSSMPILPTSWMMPERWTLSTSSADMPRCLAQTIE